MLDQKKVLAEKELLTKRIQVKALELFTYEQNRAALLRNFLNAVTFEEDKEQYVRFKEYTEKSQYSLEQFLDLYARVLGYVLLLEDQGHLSQEFKEPYYRFQKMEELAKSIDKVRKKEIKILSKILGEPGFIAKSFSFNLFRNSLERVFSVYIRREGLLLLALVKNALESKEEISRINRLLNTEKKKDKVYLALSGATWMVPVAGTLLFLLSDALLKWLNSYSGNYQELERLLK